MNGQRWQSMVVGIVCGMWLMAVGWGMWALVAFSNSAGQIGNTPPTWPASTGLQRNDERYRLVMFVHPRCPCSDASIEQLARVLAMCDGRVDATVCFYRPAESDAAWARTRLWRQAARIPGVEVLEDPANQIACRFGARTSGFTVLYAPDGRLLFCGGITAGRGHQGDNAGATAILNWIAGKSTTRCVPVFGCPLDSSQANDSVDEASNEVAQR